MFTMDIKYKGITWVGNIYDKFEAMCHEVEDIMNQETAKYVENQVQSVGGNIKNMCAEVMNDLLPPSSEDPVKEEGSDMSVEKNAELGTCKMAKLDSKDTSKKENVPHKILEVIAPAVRDSSLVSFLGGVPKITHLLPLASVNPDFSLEQNDADKHKKSKVVTEDDPIEENPPTHEVSEVIGSFRGDSTQPSLVVGVEVEDLMLPLSFSELAQEENDYVGKCKKSIVDIRGDSMKENPLPSDASKLIDSAQDVSNRESNFSRPHNENHEKSCATLIKMLSENSGEITVDISPRHGGNIDCEILGQRDWAAEDSNALCGSSVVLCEKQAMEIEITTPSSSILSMKTNAACLMESSTDELEQCYIDTEIEAFTTGRSDDDGAELEEATDEFVLGMQNIEQFDNVKLEDSCIVVQPFTVSCRERRHRSYKKKFRDAFASRMRSKKKEYEQLDIWYSKTDAETNQQRIESSTQSTPIEKLDSKNLSTDDICEWEIL